MKSDNILIDSSLSLNSSKINNINYNYYENDNRNIYNSKMEISSKRKKRVKFIEEPKIIDVECWKKYNLDQTAEENFENYLEELENKENKENKEINNKKTKNRNKSKDSITCTCNII